MTQRTGSRLYTPQNEQGFLGAGHVARTVLTGGFENTDPLVTTNYPVLITNSRRPASLADLVASIGGSLTAADFNQAITQANILFVAVPWTQLPELANQLQGYSGKILVDATNKVGSVSPFQLADTAGKPTGEYVASLLPAQRVVKAFNSLAAATIAQSSQTSLGDTVILMSGDDADAKKEVADIIRAMGFAPIDIGNFRQAAHLQGVGGALYGIELLWVKR